MRDGGVRDGGCERGRVEATAFLRSSERRGQGRHEMGGQRADPPLVQTPCTWCAPTLKAQLRTTVARSVRCAGTRVPAAVRRCGGPPITPCVMAPRPASPCVGIAARRENSNHALIQQHRGCARLSRYCQGEVSGCARDSGDLARPRLPVLNPLAANPDSSGVSLAEATGSPSTSSLTVHQCVT